MVEDGSCKGLSKSKIEIATRLAPGWQSGIYFMLDGVPFILLFLVVPVGATKNLSFFFNFSFSKGRCPINEDRIQ